MGNHRKIQVGIHIGVAMPGEMLGHSQYVFLLKPAGNGQAPAAHLNGIFTK